MRMITIFCNEQVYLIMNRKYLVFWSHPLSFKRGENGIGRVYNSQII